MKLKVTACLVGFVFIYIILNLNYWKQQRTLYWDKSGYYLYLPATLIYKDVKKLGFLHSMNEKYRFTPGEDHYSLYRQPNGNLLNKYHVGVSVFQLPFFAIAHVITLLSRDYPPDGYSPYYMLWGCISSAFWSALGLLVLGNFLRRYFTTTATIVTLLLLAFGTNLYVYSSFDTGMSHPYSFFLMACLLNYTDKWYKTGKGKYTLYLGLTAGFIFLVRPVNIIALLIPLLWQTPDERITQRMSFFIRQRKSILIACLAGLAVASLQLWYWKSVTGNWLVYSYEGEYFEFLQPHIWEGLFSYRKGWFVYTPLALIAFTGFFFLKKYTYLLLPLLATLVLTIYIVFSWKCWYYGGSFGCRALIEFLPLLAFPLAALVDQLLHSKRVIRLSGSAVLVAALSLNLWQTYQFSVGVVQWDNTTREFYWRVFFKLKSTPEDHALLHK